MIRAYLKSQKGILFSMILAVIIFPLFEFLLNIGWEDSCYSVLLYVVIMFLYLCYDFYHFKRNTKS